MSNGFETGSARPRLVKPCVSPTISLALGFALFGCTGNDDAVSSNGPAAESKIRQEGQLAARGLLPQDGNPINTALDGYKQHLNKAGGDVKKWGDVLVYYQYPNGGWIKQGFMEKTQGYATGVMDPAIKAELYKVWNTPSGYTLILDNGSTITELATLGYTYRQFKDPTHKAAAQKTMDLLLTAQRSTGGWQQYFPARSQAYSAHATFNDEVMMRILITLQKAVRKEDPFNSDIFTADQLARAEAALPKAIDYILKSQIRLDGKLTVWCAQHNMQTYAPENAREFELASMSGQESALIVAFLMSQPQTPEIAAAIKGALDWYNDPKVYVANTLYVRPKSKSDNPYQNAPGRRMWYRFYDLKTNKGFFCDRDGIPLDDIQKLGEERYTGYVWAGPWGENLLSYANKVGLLGGTSSVRERPKR